MIVIYVIISVILIILGKTYFNGGKCRVLKDLKGKVIFITGSTSGIGKELALQLSRQGATLILACRNIDKARLLVNQMNSDKVRILKLDLSDLDSVRNCVKEFNKLNIDKIDILINNAAVMAPLTHQLTKQGHEIQFGTNYLGHFLLTELLMNTLLKSDAPLVINLASVAHKMYAQFDLDDLNLNRYKNSILWPIKYSYTGYGNSKLCMIMHAQELSQRYPIKACSVHPGVVRTNILQNQLQMKPFKILLTILYPFFVYFTKSPIQGIQTILHCAQTEVINGGYYSDCCLAHPSYITPELSNGLWMRSLELIK